MEDQTFSSGGAERRGWTLLRLALGMGQMGCAATSGVLLLATGISRVALGAVVLTCALTTLSVVLFGSRAPRGRKS